MKVSNVEVYGLNRAVRTARYPKVSNVEEYYANYNEEEDKRAWNNLNVLAKTAPGTGHDQALTGITVYFDLTISIQAWQEFERYRFLNFVSSTSKMHKLNTMVISDCCNEYVCPETIALCERLNNVYNHKLEEYKKGLISKEDLDKAFYYLVYNIPQGFEYTAGMVTNYRCLKTMYGQRRNHRLQEWKDFCKWIETLPESQLITGFFHKK